MVVMTTRGRAVVLVVALALAASLLTLAVVLAKPAQAQAGTSTLTDQSEFNGSFLSCANEFVQIQGTINTVVHSTTDANGEVHNVSRSNIQGVGESDSGAKYVFNANNQFIENSSGGAPYFNVTFTQSAKLIRQGEATPTDDDRDISLLIHQTVNAQGKLTSEIIKVEEVCT
jgi:hypothetical protein